MENEIKNLWKQLKKTEVSLQGKLSRELKNLLGKEFCNDKLIDGNWDTTYIDSKESRYTLFGISSVRNKELELVDLKYSFGLEKQIPNTILENKEQILNLFVKYKSLYNVVQFDTFEKLKVLQN